MNRQTFFKALGAIAFGLVLSPALGAQKWAYDKVDKLGKLGKRWTTHPPVNVPNGQFVGRVFRPAVAPRLNVADDTALMAALEDTDHQHHPSPGGPATWKSKPEYWAPGREAV
jgi:hypothetical protein